MIEELKKLLEYKASGLEFKIYISIKMREIEQKKRYTRRFLSRDVGVSESTVSLNIKVLKNANLIFENGLRQFICNPTEKWVSAEEYMKMSKRIRSDTNAKQKLRKLGY